MFKNFVGGILGALFALSVLLMVSAQFAPTPDQHKTFVINNINKNFAKNKKIGDYKNDPATKKFIDEIQIEIEKSINNTPADCYKVASKIISVCQYDNEIPIGKLYKDMIPKDANITDEDFNQLSMADTKLYMSGVSVGAFGHVWFETTVIDATELGDNILSDKVNRMDNDIDNLNEYYQELTNQIFGEKK